MAGRLEGKVVLVTGAASGIGRAADVTDEVQVGALVDATVEAFGRLDAAHDNAGITGAIGAIQDLDLEGWMRTLTANRGLDPGVEEMIRASQPGGRLGTADEIAEAMVWPCSDRSSFVSGASLAVDGAAVCR
jgi:NAD(P)-dependent dehydrogenase (short-subunit alcohol dehydrogenase family)